MVPRPVPHRVRLLRKHASAGFANGKDVQATEQLTLLPILTADTVPAIALAGAEGMCVHPAGKPSVKWLKIEGPDPNALWITVNQAMALSRLGRTKVNELISDGSFRQKKVGWRTLIERASVDDFMTAAPTT
jgi:excisionase family DNA binding protein